MNMLNYINLKLLVIALFLCFPETQIWGSTLAQRVKPTSYIEDNERFIHFSCGENLYTGYELLSWYQIKGAERILLNMIQQDYNIVSTWRTVELYKTLQLSDNGTEILCAKENILDGIVQESDKILIKFQKNIPPLERYITIEPKSDDVILFDEYNSKLHFTCSGSEPIDYRSYTWYLQGPGKDITYTIPQYQRYDASSNTYTLTLDLNMDDHQSQLFCAQDYHFNFSRETRIPPLLRYGELARSNMIRLIHQGKGNITDKPLVRPEKFIDNNNSHIELKCYAFLQKRELLSWYQIKGSETILLKMIQLENLRYEKGQWIILILKKTLMYSDNGTNFYCAKERLKPDGNFSKGPESERIPIMFEREILALETPVVTVEPKDTIVYFDVGNTLHFNCSGSKPLDGRNYTWFIRDPDSKLTIPMDQTYDASINQNTLTLSMHESHHENTLFCAQKYHLYIQHSSGSSMKMYGELARSNMITLVQWERVKTHHLLITIVPPLLFVVLLVMTIVVVVVICRRRRPEPSREDKEEDVYTYAYAGRVTYANLDLPRASATAYATTLATREPDNYVNIVGVLNQKSDTRL